MVVAHAYNGVIVVQIQTSVVAVLPRMGVVVVLP